MVNNTEAQEPQVTLKRDGAIKEEFDTPVPLANLPAELAKRNDGALVGAPIKVQIEYKLCFNVVVIETVAVNDIKAAKVHLSLPILFYFLLFYFLLIYSGR
jgi:hypothetical protein